MKTAVLQLTTGRDMATNIDKILSMIGRAASAGAEFITMPETCHLMELDRKILFQSACTEAKDPGLKAFQHAARDHNVWLHVGSMIIKLSDDKLANRSYLIAPTGQILTKYDKLHMFDVTLSGGEIYRESANYQAGNTAVLAQTPIGQFGLSVCYDLRFPHLYRALAQKGAQVLLVPSAFTVKTGEAHWHTLLKARAIETGCFVIAAAQSGLHETGRSTFGHSLVVSPWGEILLDAGGGEGLHLVDLDLSEIDKVRNSIPSIVSDRPFEVCVESFS